jgi:PAS domain S-box-containing protein
MKTNVNCTSELNTAIGIIFHLADGTIQSCNANAAELLGYTVEQLVGASAFDPPWQTIHEHGSIFLPETYPAIFSLRTGRVCSDVVMGFYQPSGELVWLSIDTLPLFKIDKSKPYGVEVTFRDITEDIVTQITSQNSPQKKTPPTEVARLLTDFLPGIIYVYDVIAETNTYINHQAYDLLGYTVPEISEMGANFVAQRMRPEDLIRFSAHLERLASSKRDKIYDFKYRMRHKNGEWRWFNSQDRVYNRLPDGSVCQIIGAAQDITERQQIDETLSLNKERLQLATVTCGLGMWFWDLTTDCLEWTEQCKALFGLTPDIEMSYEVFLNALHPEDRDLTHAAVQQALASKTEYNVEYRTVWADGSIHWILAQGRGFYNSEGEPLRMIGIAQDITERKLAKETVERSEQHLRRVLDSLFTFVGVMTPDGVLTEVNRPALDIANLQPEDVIGKPFAETYWWSYSSESQALLNNSIEQAKLGEAVRYDVKVRLNATDYMWIDFALAPLFDADGKLEYIIPSGIDISDRRQAEKATRYREQQLTKVLDTLPVYVGLLDPEGRVININQTALDLSNLKLEELIDKPFAETYWWDFSKKVQAKINEAIQQAAAGEMACFNIVARGTEKDERILVDFSMTPVFDPDGEVEYLIPTGIDITEREKSKQALEQRERELKLITEVIPQQVWTALPDGEIDYINQRWQDFTGVTLEQIQNCGWEGIVHPDDLERVIQAWNKAVETGNDYSVEARWREQKGKYHWFLNRAKPLRNEAGEITQWYGTNTDITQIKALEVQLQQQTEDLIQANQLKDEFLAIVSHELRTPLNPILGWSQLLSAGRLDPERITQGIGIIQRNAKLQAQLIEDLLDVSRILRGKLELKVMPLSLETIIKSAISTVQLTAEAKSIEIVTSFEPNIGQVSGDAGRLQQIVWNLVSNAIKFTPEGGRVTVDLKRVNTQALIQVIDTGNGIEPEFLPYVFERFRQAESNSTRKFGGLGLGLAIVRHLTELHHGTVTADSSGEGQGATFSVKLPLLNIPIIEQSEGEQSNKPRETNPLNGLQVLVVDDEVDSLDLLTFVLEQDGAKVTAVASANAAIEAFNASTPDLIISDIGMPEVDGYTLITQIRALPQGKNIPAIALTAYAGEVDKQRSIDSGYQQHISKPIDLTELIAIVSRSKKELDRHLLVHMN